MKKINLLIVFLGLLLCSYNAMADLTVAVSVTSVQVTGMCDLDGFGSGDSDPQWDIDVSDNRDYSEAFDHELTSNGPSITVSSGYDNSLTFSKAYTGVCPPNFLTVDRSGYEDDGVFGTEVRFGQVYQWAVPTTAGTYTLTRSGTASGCSGTITWTINLQMVVTGTLNYTCSDTPCAASVQSLQDPCVTALNYTFYDVSSSTQTFSDASTSCAYDGNKDIFFQLQAPTSGAFTLWVGNWDDWGASTLSDLTGNLYTGSSCSPLSIVSQNIIDGQGDTQNTNCIDFSSGLFNDNNEGPFSVTGLTPGATYYLRVSEEDDQPANVTLAFAEKAIEDNCVTAQPLTGDGCNYNAVGGDFNTPYDVGASPDCGWSSMDNSVFYSFSVTASTPQPVSVTVENINCDNTGGGTLQLGIWKKPAGICTNVALQSLSNYVACASGTGTVTVNGGTLPVGDYLLVADGNAGAQCRWNFESVALLSCSITAVDANIGTTCNDNGTPTDATDDYYVATVTVTYNNPPATGNLVLSGSAIAASTPTANLTQAVGALATPAVFNNIHIKAGVTNQTITATFSADGACTFSNNTISSSAACAASCPAAPMVGNDTGASCSGGTDDFATWQTGRSNAVAAVDNGSTVSTVEYSTALPTAAVPATGNTTVTGTNVACGVKAQTFTQTLITKENDVIIDPEFDPYHKIVAWQSKEGYVCVSNIDTIDWSIDFSSTVVVDSNATPITETLNGPEIIYNNHTPTFAYNTIVNEIKYIGLATKKDVWYTEILTNQPNSYRVYGSKGSIPCICYSHQNSKKLCYKTLSNISIEQGNDEVRNNRFAFNDNTITYVSTETQVPTILYLDSKGSKRISFKKDDFFSSENVKYIISWRSPEYNYKRMILLMVRDEADQIIVLQETYPNSNDYETLFCKKNPSNLFNNMLSYEVGFLDGKSYLLFMVTSGFKEVSAEPAEIWLMNMDTTNIQVSKLAGGINDTITDPEILPTDSTLWVYYTKVIDKDKKGFYSMYESDFRLPVYRSSTNIYPTNVFSLETVNKQTPVKWLKIKSEKIKIKEPGIVEVFDKWGSKMAQQKINNCHRRLNTKHLKTGVYDVVLTNKHERKVYKVYVTSKK